MNNKYDASIYNENSLNLLNIRELRALGRNVGVSAPASKKKNELIQGILDIVYGKVKSTAKTSMGRPANDLDLKKSIDKIKKNNQNISEVFNYTSTESYDLGNFSSFDSGIKLAIAEPSMDYKLGNNIETRTFFKDNGKYYLKVKGFVSSDRDIEVLESIKLKYGLEDFDVVEVVLIDNYYKIYSINGIKAKNRISKIYVDGKFIEWGRSQDFYLSTKEELTNNIEKLANDCITNNLKLIILAKEEYNYEKSATIKYALEENESQIYKKLMMFIYECEKSIYEGDDLVIVVESLNEIEEKISKLDFDIFERTKKYFHDVITKIVDIGNIYLKFNIEDNINY